GSTTRGALRQEPAKPYIEVQHQQALQSGKQPCVCCRLVNPMPAFAEHDRPFPPLRAETRSDVCRQNKIEESRAFRKNICLSTTGTENGLPKEGKADVEQDGPDGQPCAGLLGTGRFER
ncbi:MAG TPA: hypothetical protein VE527_19155, partial [Reyranella sp.]|nr:hypothetical protein [Reyranella sp.]